MSLEDLTGTSKYIDALNKNNPDGALDGKNEGDNHIKGVKNVILNTWPNIDGPINYTPAEANVLAGVTPGTVTASKGLVVDANKAIDGLTTLPLYDSGILAAAVTTHDISGLNLSETESYAIVFSIMNTAGSNSSYALTVNGDHTMANYYNQVTRADGGTTTVARSTSPNFCRAESGESVNGTGTVFVDNDLYYSLVSQSQRGRGSGVDVAQYSASKIAALTGNITSMRITAGIASAIGIGSRFRIYKTI